MTQNRKTDRRTIYTRTIIKDSFLDLMHQLPYDKITVSGLCTRAEISRTTFYLHYDSIDSVLDAVLDDALLFSEKSTGNLFQMMDAITSGGSSAITGQDQLLPACQRIANSEKYHSLFMDPVISDHIIHRIARHEHDTVISNILEKTTLTEEEAEMIFRFILNGSFAVNRSLGWQKNDSWYRFQTLVSRFVQGGLNNLK